MQRRKNEPIGGVSICARLRAWAETHDGVIEAGPFVDHLLEEGVYAIRNRAERSVYPSLSRVKLFRRMRGSVWKPLGENRCTKCTQKGQNILEMQEKLQAFGSIPNVEDLAKHLAGGIPMCDRLHQWAATHDGLIEQQSFAKHLIAEGLYPDDRKAERAIYPHLFKASAFEKVARSAWMPIAQPVDPWQTTKSDRVRLKVHLPLSAIDVLRGAGGKVLESAPQPAIMLVCFPTRVSEAISSLELPIVRGRPSASGWVRNLVFRELRENPPAEPVKSIPLWIRAIVVRELEGLGVIQGVKGV